jgi:hypothetical protein
VIFHDFHKDSIIASLKKIIHLSDNFAAWYKSWKIHVTFTLHQNAFGMAAGWHLFPTFCGKSTYSGLIGTCKRGHIAVALWCESPIEVAV